MAPRGHPRAHRASLMQRQKAERERVRAELRARFDAERDKLRERCAAKKQRAAERAASVEARERRQLAAQKELDQALSALQGRQQRAERRATAAERRRESDDEVRANIPDELVPVWQKVRRSIRASDRRTRTEAFMQWVEENPGEVWAIREADQARELAKLEREARRAERPGPVKASRAALIRDAERELSDLAEETGEKSSAAERRRLARRLIAPTDKQLRSGAAELPYEWRRALARAPREATHFQLVQAADRENRAARQRFEAELSGVPF